LKTRDIKNIINKCYQLGALLLVVLFLSITIVQALHSHKSCLQIEQSFNSSDETVSNSNPCQLCDYLTHEQGKQLFISYGSALVLSVPEPIVFHAHNFIGNYKFTLQGFTNKGPPALFC